MSLATASHWKRSASRTCVEHCLPKRPQVYCRPDEDLNGDSQSPLTILGGRMRGSPARRDGQRTAKRGKHEGQIEASDVLWDGSVDHLSAGGCLGTWPSWPAWDRAKAADGRRCVQEHPSAERD